jgi:hypothetical protein
MANTGITIKKIMLKGEVKSMGSLSLGFGKFCGVCPYNTPERKVINSFKNKPLPETGRNSSRFIL